MRALRRLYNFVRPSRAESELEREVAAHLSLLAADCQRRGMTAEESRLAARRALGGVEQLKELHRAERSFLWLEDARRDVRFRLRTFARNPAFTAVAVGTLAVGIGATTAIFSVVNTVLLRPLPYADPERLVRIVENVPAAENFSRADIRLSSMNVEEFVWWRQEIRSARRNLEYGWRSARARARCFGWC